MSSQDYDVDGAYGRPVYKPFRSEGAKRITAERKAQVTREGFTTEADARHYHKGELVLAAISYAAKALFDHGIEIFKEGPTSGHIDARNTWPSSWDISWDKRKKHSTIRCLEIAGALIAAEIDRRLALGEG